MASTGFALLCSSALEHDGLVSILGGGLDRVTAPQLPIQVIVTLVARVVWTDEELGQPHVVRFSVEHADGEQLVQVDGSALPTQVPGTRSDIPVGQLLIQPLPLEIQRAGHYKVTISLDGQHLAELPLLVEPTPPPP